MTMQTKQVFLYGLSTSAFYTEKEKEIKNQYYTVKYFDENITKLNKWLSNGETEEAKNDIQSKIDKLTKDYNTIINQYPVDMKVNEMLDEIDKMFYAEMDLHSGTRTLDESKLHIKNVIGQFESTFTRSLGIETDSLTTDFMVVRVYYFKIMEDLIHNGYTYNGEKYVFAFASSGQIRQKKLVFVRESKMKEIHDQLFVGLTDKKIGEISINKYIAYKALTNSSSVKWEGFDVNKAIVVPDFNFIIKGKKVEHINANYNVKPDTKDIEFNVMDGCGIMLPTVSETNLQFRGAGGFKGLLSPFDFKEFIEKNKQANQKVIDVWGKEWDIIEDGIEVIFTSSQMKFYKYVTNKDNPKQTWDDFKKSFKEYQCEFAICDEDSLNDEDYEDKELNYQMIQTLVNVEDKELKQLVKTTNERIENVASTIEKALVTLEATEYNKHRRPIQEALMIHNELLNDPYIKQMIKDKKKSLVKDARAGKLLLEGSKRTFLIPDLYAFAQHLFGLDVTGLLEDRKVSCSLYQNEDKLDVLRSPHLHLNEHCIRTNVVNDEIKNWFTTEGIYTSIHDEMSKIIMFDNDGDSAMIVSDKLFVDIAERHVEGMNSLDYELGVSKPEEITNENIYKSLVAAYEMNIGEISNSITKLLNQDGLSSEDVTKVKQLVYLANQAIDYAKTKWLAEVPEELQLEFDKLKKAKVPHFFRFAKDKKKKQVADRNDSTVNRLFKLISNKRVKFFEGDQFDYTILMKNKDVVINDEIVNKYKELTRYNHIAEQQGKNQGDSPVQIYYIKYIRDELLKFEKDINVITDVLVKYLYGSDATYKKYLWDVFGEVIVDNLKVNKGLKKRCSCGTAYKPSSNRQGYCAPCSRENKRKNDAKRKAKQRAKSKIA